MAHRRDETRRGGAALAVSLVGDDDSRLVEALEAYFAAMEAGEAPSRREFLERYADVGPRLEQCLDGLEIVRSAAVGFTSETRVYRPPAGMPTLPASGRLGDYQIVGEVGRGGMGVVYQAVQVSLGRRVALKVLPAGLATDKRLLERFRLEAHAAAQLHHAHIVPVFAVGCDEGVHYYAMQFIDGPTLADVIAALRDPSGGGSSRATPSAELRDATGRTRPRAVARLGVEAARALEHAHGLGVVHRDIKPANLMLDERGHLWVTDFGLARVQEDTGLTITGDLLGTLRYMSPEQVTGRRATVDHRADVYALGTTLYELLTLRPAVSGRDRHDLIRQIAHDEPERPRRIDPTIPRELETILLKAMAKEPAERYATAAELADDLQRFLDDKPIHARPPTPIDRAWKWARRHRGLVAAATGLLLIASVLLGISTVLIARERDRVAQKSRRTEERLGLAMRVLEEVNLAMVEKWLALEPEHAGLKHEFLNKALAGYRQLAEELGEGPQGRLDAALAFRRVGDIEYRLGRLDESERAYRRGLEILEDLHAGPDAIRLGVSAHLVGQCRQLGHLLQATIRDGEAEAFYHKAVAYHSPAGLGGPSGLAADSLAGLHLDLGLLYLREGRLESAKETLGQALRDANAALRGSDLAACDDRGGQAFVHAIQSHLREAEGRYAEAVAEARQARALYRELSEEDPDRLPARHGLTQTTFRLAWLLGTCEDASVRDAEEAIRLAREATDSDPQNAKYHHQLGALLIATADHEGAEAEFRTAMELVPGSPNAQNSLAWVLATRERPSREHLKEAVELARRAVAGSPQTGIFWNTLGVALYHLGDYQESVRSLARSMDLRSGGDSFDWFFLAMARWRLGSESEAQQWLSKAESWMDSNRPGDHELATFRSMAREVFATTPEVLAQGNPPRIQPQAGAAKPARVGRRATGFPRNWPPLSTTTAGAVAFALGLASFRGTGAQAAAPPTLPRDAAARSPVAEAPVRSVTAPGPGRRFRPPAAYRLPQPE